MIDKNEFQKTFSVLHASEGTLTEVLNMANQRKKHPRALPIVLAAMLTICLLATTAVAVPIIYERITGNIEESWNAETPTDAQGNSVKGRVHQVKVEVPMNEDAPSEIETYYMPHLSSEYKQSFGKAYAGHEFDRLDVICLNWDVSENEIQAIRYSQHSAHSYEVDGMGCSLFITDGQEPELREVSLGGVEGYWVVAPDETNGEQYFFWTNGDYVFNMRFPIRFTEEQIAKIIATVRPVEDIQPFMLNMTDEEMAKVFGE